LIVEGEYGAEVNDFGVELSIDDYILQLDVWVDEAEFEQNVIGVESLGEQHASRSLTQPLLGPCN